MTQVVYRNNVSSKSKSLYSVQMQENTDQKKSEYGHFLLSVFLKKFIYNLIPSVDETSKFTPWKLKAP